MRASCIATIAVLTLGACAALAAPPPAPPAKASTEGVQFTIRICESKDKLKFWYNGEAREHWNSCKTPLPDIPVYIVTTSGKREEGKTGKDGVAELPQVTLSWNEKFRLAMACTTYHCFAIHGLSLNSPDIRPGANLLFAEAPAKDVGAKPN